MYRLAGPVVLVATLIALPARAETGADAQTTPLPPAIADSTAAELTGINVENRRGAGIGTLAGIVRSPQGTLIGVVRPSGLGPGVLRGEGFPLTEFRRRGDRLVAPTNEDAAMLDDSQVWETGGYQAVTPDVPLSRLSQTPALRSGMDDANPVREFTELDVDQNGGLTPEEAHVNPRVGENWIDLDANADGIIDSSEFRALSETAVKPGMEETQR